MQINFYSLSLQCRKSKEVIDLNFQVLFFHGRVSSGKSSIARLINFCLGGNIERTIAIQKEVTSVALDLAIGRYKVLLERNTNANSVVTATWVDEEGHSFTLNVPVNAGPEPVWSDKIYSLSDLIFYLLDVNVIRIPANKIKENSSLVRLSLKNFMWYCYLDQNKMDNSFFRHEDSTKARNSKEVLKYILQYSTQKLLELQEKLYETKKSRFAKRHNAEGLRNFLKKFNFSTVEEIEFYSEATRKKLERSKEDRERQEHEYRERTHFVDQIRERIRNLIGELAEREQGIIDLERRLEQQETLKSELVSSKFKLAKSQAIATVFQGVKFTNCPDCGTSLTPRVVAPDTCGLCLSPLGAEQPEIVEQAEVIQLDLTDRIREIEASIDLHKKSLSKTKKEFAAKQQLRRELDQQLEHDLRQYESVFLSNVRAIDQKVATFKERLKSIDSLKKMPEEINRLEDEVVELAKLEKSFKRQIENERANFVRGEALIEELEATFLNILNEVGMPGVSDKDEVSINRKNWDITILPAGEEYLRWNFYNAGSGGKKTLFNSCFLLALHVVASKNDLPLPSFIVIDSPMKNIDKEVNQDIFKRFYDYVYQLAGTVLDKTQIIIIDNNYIPPSPDSKISFKDRNMIAGDPNNPPLIPYYAGP